jgi:hypothetical protein
VQFTLSKDRQTLYAFVDDLSENSITIPDVVESVNGPVFLLGHEKELSWKSEDGGLKIDLSGILLNELVVYTFKIPVTPLLDKPN